MQTFPKKEIRELIDFVWDNPHSYFYRTLWEENGLLEKPTVKTAQDFTGLPLLTRSNIARFSDPTKRAYMDMSEIDTLTLTSGTTGGDALLFWHKIPEHSTRLVPYQKNVPTILMSFNLQNKFLIHAVRGHYASMQVLAGDAHNLKYSANVAQKAGVNTLYITPTLALLFADYLASKKHLENITMLALWGEYCSDASYALLQERYKNAHFVLEYSSTEADHIAYATDACDSPNRLKHVDTDAQYLEIIDDEIVLTTLGIPRSNPLVRYRTGDKARFVAGVCACGSTRQRIELLGRIDGDIIRVAGGEVKTEELDRIMVSFQPFVESNFYLEISERNTSGKIVPHFTLFVQKKTSAWMDDNTLRERLALTITNEFRLSPSLLIKDAVSSGMLLPVAIELISVETKEKHKRIKRTT